MAQGLGVAGRDMGIDLVAVDAQGLVSAVQCKYRTGTGWVPGRFVRRDVVPWRDLATFYALCARTGPWSRHLVMTNAVGVRAPARGPKDTSICRGSLRALTAADMGAMLALHQKRSPPSPLSSVQGISGVGDDPLISTLPPPDQSLREKRLRWINAR